MSQESSDAELFVLAPGQDSHSTVRSNRHIEHDGPATDLTIFNVALLGQRVVDHYRDGLAAVGAGYCLFGKFGQ